MGSWHPVVDELKQDCRAVLRSVATSTISTWRDIEWEISNSCLMEDWDRVRQLYERAKELYMQGEMTREAFQVEKDRYEKAI